MDIVGPFILMMVWSTASSYGGVTVVQQEFLSLQKCEVAKEALAKAHTGRERILSVSGCFKK